MDPQTNRHNGAPAFVLVGPTAAGKTAVAQWIAERWGIPILSADSMLVYRGMDIGTAKPTGEERRRVQYWGLDLANPDELFSVARFREEAMRCVGALPPGKPIIVVGGTGLYLRVLIEGLAPGPPPSPAKREHWRRVLAEQGIEGLQKVLRERSGPAYDSLADKRNPRRIMRALERVEEGAVAAGADWDLDAMPFVVGLCLPREVLHARIRARVAAMYQQGLMAETAQLGRGYGALSATAMQAIGYREAAACLAGDLSLADAQEATVVRTRQLAKRQMTWFRRQLRVRWVDVDASMSVECVARAVMAEWDRLGPVSMAV